MAATRGKLAGFTVLDLASVGPAARCTRILAGYGADVVKVGPVSKKAGKQIRPPFFSYGAGRGMRRIQIDLKAPEGRETLLALANQADVLIESFRPGVVKRLGIGYDDVTARNPGIVYCSTTGYGQDGPASTWAGHDINYLAMAGLLACTEPREDGGPPILGATVADSAGGGMHAALSILAALVKRAQSGKGAYLDVSATEGVLSLMAIIPMTQMQVARAQLESRATQLCRQQLEVFGSLAYSDSLLAPGGPYSDPANPIDGRFQHRWTVTADQPIADCKTVMVEVDWSHAGSARQVEATTVMARN